MPAETFSDDYAGWLLDKTVALTTFSPKELSLEPIPADEVLRRHIQIQESSSSLRLGEESRSL